MNLENKDDLDKASLQDEAKVVRIRIKDNKIVQDCDVYIGRMCRQGGWRLPKSKWHNPFTVKEYGSAKAAIEAFELYILGNEKLLSELDELRGKTLGCWCKNKGDEPCHGDVLVKLLNKTRPA